MSSSELFERVRSHKARALELAEAGDLAAASAEYKAALELQPSDVVARQRLAELFARLGDTRRAIEHYLCLVGKYAVEGHLLRAIATCHRILLLDPEHAATLHTLTDLYAERSTRREPVRIPSNMSHAIRTRPSEPPLVIDRERLARIPLFSDLTRDAFESMLRKFQRVVVPPCATIVQEGEPGDAMFAIAQGVVRVERRVNASPRIIAEMGEGEFFGEMSLLSHCPRFASVVAVTECELLRLGRTEMEQLVAEHPRVGHVLQTFYKERLVANVTRASLIFRELAPEDRDAIVDLFRIEMHAAGEMLLEEGQPGGEGLYVLLRGKCDVFHRADGGEQAYPSMGEGDVFGEVSLLQGGNVTACVRTASPCVVLGLKRKWVDEMLLVHPAVRDVIYDLATRRLERTQEILAKEMLDERLV